MMRKIILMTAFLLSLFVVNQGQAAAAFHTLEGKKISLTALKGKWVFINYWAGWCHPCLEEIPQLNRFAKAYEDKVVLFAVNYDDLPIAEQQALLKHLKIEYTGLRSDPATELQLGEVNAVPVTFVFDPQGRHVKTLYGPQSLASLTKVMT